MFNAGSGWCIIKSIIENYGKILNKACKMQWPLLAFSIKSPFYVESNFYEVLRADLWFRNVIYCSGKKAARI